MPNVLNTAHTLLASLLLFTGCAQMASDPITSGGLTTANAPNLTPRAFSEQLTDTTSLEARILAVGDEEPLALGPLGTALIERHPESLTGHYALMLFYKHVDAADIGLQYQQAFDERLRFNLQSGDGSTERPYQVLSKADAELMIRAEGQTIVGSIYQSSKPSPLQLLLLTRADDRSPVISHYFDLPTLIPASRGRDPETDIEADNPWDTLRILADNHDSAARAAIGTYLTRQRRYDAAIGWLELAAREENLLAHTLLARIYWYQSGSAEKADKSFDKNQLSVAELTQLSMDNHIKAVELGSTESMYTLGRLLLEDSKGQGDGPQQGRALEFLQRAGTLGHAESYLYLANQYQRGLLVEKNENLANRYFAQAADLRNPKAIISYARYIVASPNRQSQTSLMPLLEELADTDNPEAMVVIGNLYARGVSVKRSNWRAVRWYKKAVAQAEASHHGSAAVINEVAWILAVSNQKGLQKPSYAQAIMDTMMQSNKDVQTHPEYLDTWAATYAANGNFPKAIELQKRALHFARTQDRTDVIDILQTHLESFEAGANITDRTP